MSAMFGRIPATWAVRADYAYEDRYGGGTDGEKAEAFDRWLDQVRADAWDEGRKAGVDDMIAAELGTFRSRKPNPYRTIKEN
ncbi:hypothetical protein NCCP2495_05670 [Dietzia sp. NCCP-2495]|uniref:hypothetical protein n=1 Tax=Dietzia sp. NCCP-2495 TaxID=2934675 RepID=UPI002230F53D|nr:hypothetical protein [Dietzia sp. NCCP-2495]GLB62689.1 hypothetical protein NCCP2495_05670 [Dietzia sp. NCCP-2495]